MARPSNLNDLKSHDKEAHDVFSLDLSKVELSVQTAPIYTAVANLGELFELAGFQVTMDGSSMSVKKQRTMEELTSALQDAQSEWDHTREQYLQAIQDPASINVYLRWRIDNHAKKEGMPAVEWPVEKEDDEN